MENKATDNLKEIRNLGNGRALRFKKKKKKEARPQNKNAKARAGLRHNTQQRGAKTSLKSIRFHQGDATCTGHLLDGQDPCSWLAVDTESMC